MSEHQVGESRKATVEDVKVGDRIKDNDPRMSSRVLVVRRIWFPLSGNRDEAKAIVDDLMGRPFALLLRRIHTDGKPRRSGFDLIRTEPSGID